MSTLRGSKDIQEVLGQNYYLNKSSTNKSPGKNSYKSPTRSPNQQMAQMTPVSIKISNHKSTIKTLEMIDENKEAIQRAPTA